MNKSPLLSDMEMAATPKSTLGTSSPAIPQGAYVRIDQDEEHQQPRPWLNTLKIAVYFVLWYFFNVLYNIANKNVCNELPLYWLIGLSQLLVGSLCAFVLWGTGICKAPVLSWDDMKALFPIAFFNTFGHLGATVSLGAGAVSFTHIVKSAEPVFTSIFSAILIRQFFRWPVYLSLCPIVFGVALASVNELEFGWMSFIGAMVSNVSMSLRAIYSKVKMATPVGENMNPANLYSVVTVMSLLISSPLCGGIEAWKARSVYEKHMGNATSDKKMEMWINLVLSGVAFFAYNVMAFLALSEVHPVTHAVGNTIKRVVIIVASILVFQNPVTTMGGIGCTVAILGTLVYSLAKQQFK